MKKLALSLILLVVAIHCFSQYPIGHRQISYTDPARSNRSVTTEVYYPGTSNGENVSPATGQFPLIVFGHGFMMGYDAYLFWKNNLVPEGYIVVFPTTEGGMSPSHAEFGTDLAFLIEKLQSESASNTSSPFYQKLSATSALMGHSMGGGASFLACDSNNTPTCMVTFAAAETTPSSTTAASHVSSPALVIAGADDCVAPPASNQIPMYNALASNCKVFISIIDGVHCYFGDYNFSCTFGESTCNPVPGIQREDQEDVALDFTLLFLNHYLYNDPTAWNEFIDSIGSSNRITYQINCPTTGLSTESQSLKWSVHPNPANDAIWIKTEAITDTKITINFYTTTGKKVKSISPNSSEPEFLIDLGDLSPGLYILECIQGNKFGRQLISKQ